MRSDLCVLDFRKRFSMRKRFSETRKRGSVAGGCDSRTEQESLQIRKSLPCPMSRGREARGVTFRGGGEGGM